MDLREMAAYLFQPDLHDLLRVEALDWYDSAADDPHFARFRAGLPAQVDEGWQAWLDRIARDTREGVTWRRVHVIAADRPLTPYLAFELGEQYTRNEASGEQIRVLEVPGADLPLYRDFFAATYAQGPERVALSTYDPRGRFVRADEGGRDTGYWVRHADRLWSEAVSFGPWWANYQRKVA